jgi:hypothetical protein
MGMLTATRELTHSIDAKTAHCLGDGVDTSRLDEFLDYLFELATMHSPLICECKEDRIHVQTGDEPVLDRAIPRAKTKMRLLCARFEKRASDARGEALSPKTDGTVFDLGEGSYTVTVHNTTELQRISITREKNQLFDSGQKLQFRAKQ